MPTNANTLLGSTTPRLWTPPLRELVPAEYDRNGRLITEPTSLGFDMIDFAREDLKAPLDPWQEWTVIHGFELLPDGRTRYKKLLILVSRQNGKTHLCCVLSLYWMFVQRVTQILGTSTKLEYAKDAWAKARKMALAIPELKKEISHKGATKTVNGGVHLWRADAEEREREAGSLYKIAPATESGGRSQTNDRVLFDELRHHYDYAAYGAAEPTLSVPWSSMAVGLSNAGNNRSVVLNDWRGEAIKFIETGEGDPRVGLIEYSAEEHADPTDIVQLSYANPNMNRRGLSGEDLWREGLAAKQVGGDKLNTFKTEKMCIRVIGSNPAISLQDWIDCRAEFSLAKYRSRIALCFDFSVDEQSAVLIAAAVLDDGRVGLKVVQSWGPEDIKQFSRQFREAVTKANARALGWIPGGPAASQAATMFGAEIDAETGAFKLKGKLPAWLPRRTVVQQLRGEVPGLCMGFAMDVRNVQIAQPGDPLLDVQIPAADKQEVAGGKWIVARQDEGNVHGYYAAAGASFLARTLPVGGGKPGLIVAS